MAGLTADDIADLGRWYSIQFRDEAAALEALDRFERFRERRSRAAAAGRRERDGYDWLDEDPPIDRAA
jgi:hypothetical protein